MKAYHHLIGAGIPALFSLLLSILVLLPVSPSMANTFVVRGDTGGVLDDYKDRFKKFSSKNTLVIIDGVCASACTYVLTKSSNVRFCATPRAKLGFHKAFVKRGIHGDIVRTKWAKDYSEKLWIDFLNDLPSPIADTLQQAKIPSVYQGSRPNQIFWIKGAEAQRLLGACSKAGSA